MKTRDQTALKNIFNLVIKFWPEHERFLKKSFESRTTEQLEDSELLAGLICRLLKEDLPLALQNYKWLCEQFSIEELHFHRNGNYRFSRLEEVIATVYNDRDYMKKYMDGLLISQLFWSNHANSFSLLKRVFFSKTQHAGSHLEIGPGHGLFTYLAASSNIFNSVEAWDISATSLEETHRCLDKMGVADKVKLVLRDATLNPDLQLRFDSIVISEVLEHVEDPRSLLHSLRKILNPGGHIFINVPVNSPAPDHIYLLSSPEEAIELIEKSGLEITESHFFPKTGLSLERARKLNATVSCAIIARNPS